MVSKDWRPSTYNEIEAYYEFIFPKLTESLPHWITPSNPKEYAIALREPYPTRGRGEDAPDKQFLRRSTRNNDNPDQIFIRTWDQLCTFFQRPAARDPLAVGTNRSIGLIHSDSVDEPKPVPQAIYYALDNWEDFWVLAFDIDAKDVAKQRIARGEKTYTDVTQSDLIEHGVVNEEPTPIKLPAKHAHGSDQKKAYINKYLYTFADIERAIDMAFELGNWLKNTVGFDETQIFYSGQGTHIYAFKDDPYYKFTKQTREFIAGTYIPERLHIPIDAGVTWDSSRVMRVPFSLHTDVHRVVQKINSPEYDYRNEARVENLNLPAKTVEKVTEKTENNEH